MKKSCVPLLAELFLNSYGNEFLGKLIKNSTMKLTRVLNLSYLDTDDLLF